MHRWCSPLAFVLLLGIALPAPAQQTAHAHGGEGAAESLGEIDFPTSTAAAARPHFVRGVLYLHNFHYTQAVEAFREAQRLDPRDVMAHWGEAMAHTWPVWNTQDTAAGRAALRRLAPTREARLAMAKTPRERLYLESVEALYGEGSKARRDTAFSEAMGRLHAAHPDDPEAALFYSLSLLGLNQGDREPMAYARAADLAEPIFRARPRHPGAAHYLIHAVDDPQHAPRGLDAAHAYSEMAPGAAHAQHMTSHIFVAMGMWDDVVRANLLAQRAPPNTVSPARYGHGAFWLVYAYAQQGRRADARAWLDSFTVQLASVKGKPGAERYTRAHIAVSHAAYVVDTGDWTSPQGATVLEGDAGFGTPAHELARGWVALMRGDTATADSMRAKLAARIAAATPGEVVGAGYGRVMEGTLAAARARQAGRVDEAVGRLRAAAALEDSLPLAFGPPVTVKPAREVLGETLLAAGRAAEAVRELEAALARTPGRSSVLLALARAHRAAGQGDAARRRYAELAAVWHSADADHPALAEARAGAAGEPSAAR
jgi:Tfp pilus assembly protein PilF